ncbi:MAG: hypothetical protein ACKOZT_14460 [Cyanobium sp.]
MASTPLPTPQPGTTPESGSPAAAWSFPSPSSQTSGELLQQLRDDRLWLLRQIDSGRWPDWRLDLAALERELGQLLEQAEERLGRS